MDAAFGVVPDRDISSEVCQPVAGRSVAWRQRGAGGIAVAMSARGANRSRAMHLDAVALSSGSAINAA